MEQHTGCPQKPNVLLVLLVSKRIIGPYFININVTAYIYLDLLHADYTVPDIVDYLFLDEYRKKSQTATS